MPRIKPGWIIATIVGVIALLIGVRIARAPEGGQTPSETAGPFTAPPAATLPASAVAIVSSSPSPLSPATQAPVQSATAEQSLPTPPLSTALAGSPVAQIQPTTAPTRAGAPATAVPAATAIPQPSPETILPPGGSDAATTLRAKAECDVSQPQHGIAKLSWVVASHAGSEQRVDVTIYSFENGQFEMSESLPPEQSSLVWTGVKGQAIHFWRVLTRHGDPWVSSEIQTFEGAPCIGDFGQPSFTPGP